MVRAEVPTASRAPFPALHGWRVRSQASRHRKDGILNLKEHMDKKVRVKFTGGREGV